MAIETPAPASQPQSKPFNLKLYLIAGAVLAAGYFIQTLRSRFEPIESGTFKFEVIHSHERGHSDHGWLQTFHTFPFAGWTSAKHESFGPLRVLNEDRVQPTQGFGTHSHSEYEIFSYVVSGQLEHKDSMGNTKILKRGDIQLTSAGTGIRHSEGCCGDESVHFLQIWAYPSTRGLIPKYFTRHFSDDEKRDRLLKVVAPADSADVLTGRNDLGPTPVHAPLSVYASVLSPGKKTVTYAFPNSTTSKAFIHHIQSSGYQPGNVSSGGTVTLYKWVHLQEGDGAFLWATSTDTKLSLTNTGSTTAELLLFEIP